MYFQKNEQLLAAEMFIGIVLGIKHRPFFELNEFWNDLNPRLDQFFNNLTAESGDAWGSAMFSVLKPTYDLRKVWWLIEAMINGARKATTANEFQLALYVAFFLL